MKRKIILVSLERAYSYMVSAMHLNALYFRRTSLLDGNIHVVSVFYLFMKHVRYYTRFMFHMLKCIQSNLQVRLQVVRFAHQIDLNCQKETEKWVDEMVSIYSNKFQLIIKNYLDMTLGYIRIRSIITGGDYICRNLTDTYEIEIIANKYAKTQFAQFAQKISKIIDQHFRTFCIPNRELQMVSFYPPTLMAKQMKFQA